MSENGPITSIDIQTEVTDGSVLSQDLSDAQVKCWLSAPLQAARIRLCGANHHWLRLHPQRMPSVQKGQLLPGRVVQERNDARADNDGDCDT